MTITHTEIQTGLRAASSVIPAHLNMKSTAQWSPEERAVVGRNLAEFAADPQADAINFGLNLQQAVNSQPEVKLLEILQALATRNAERARAFGEAMIARAKQMVQATIAAAAKNPNSKKHYAMPHVQEASAEAGNQIPGMSFGVGKLDFDLRDPLAG